MPRFDEDRLDLAFRNLQLAVENRPPATTGVLGVATSTQTVRLEAHTRAGSLYTAAPDSVFLLASLTKPIVATAIMQLVQDGQLSLHTPVTAYLPEFDRSGKPPVTVWNLLTHTSGIGEIDWPTSLRQFPQRAVSYQIACNFIPDFAPGTRFQYSTLSFYVLAELISRLSGMPYPAFLQERIFQPLGMTDTSFDPRPANRMIPVEGITADSLLTREQVTDFFISFAMPGAGLWSTVPDLLKFGQALLNIAKDKPGAPHLLSSSSLALMTREHTIGLYKLENGQAHLVHYGLAWRKGFADGLEASPGSPYVFEHDGATGGELWLDPEWDLAFVFLTNAFGADQTVRYSALRDIYRSLSRD